MSDEHIKRLKKGERVPCLYGRVNAYATKKDIEALKNGRTLYVNVFNEYAVAIKYRKVEDDDI